MLPNRCESLLVSCMTWLDRYIQTAICKVVCHWWSKHSEPHWRTISLSACVLLRVMRLSKGVVHIVEKNEQFNQCTVVKPDTGGIYTLATSCYHEASCHNTFASDYTEMVTLISRLNVLLDWPRPHTVKEVHRFLDLAFYYQCFIPSFAHIGIPLTATTRGKRSFTWSDTKEKVFRALQQPLCETPVLAYPTRNDEFVLYTDTDASAEAIGSVLLQRQGDGQKVIAYASKTLSRTHTRYCTTHVELLVVVTVVKILPPLSVWPTIHDHHWHGCLILKNRKGCLHGGSTPLVRTISRLFIDLEARWVMLMHFPERCHGHASAPSARTVH